MIWCDRDGTLTNEETGKYICKAQDLELLPGAAQAVANLQNAGLVFCVVTNQQGLIKSEIELAEYLAMHEKMVDAVVEKGGKLFQTFTCGHLESANCFCRKPAPGLLFYSAGVYRASFENSWMIGDYWTDIVAAKKLIPSPRAILVETGRGKDPGNQRQFDWLDIKPDYVEPNILAASERILKLLRGDGGAS